MGRNPAFRPPPPAAGRRGGLLLLLAAAVAGCGGPPQIASANRELVVSLATAVSARNSAWLEANSRQIETKKAEGSLVDAEYRVLAGIVAQARAGDWKSAESAVYALRDAQKPTAEDLQHVAQRKLPPDVGKAPPGRTARTPRSNP